jgi:flagellar biosynthesis protein
LDGAPAVVAKGRGIVAQKILDLARANEVPIREDRNLVEILSVLDLDQEVPPEAYKVVAELLAFLYRINAGAVEKK